jgi:DHA3 family macrolide efflux protein-like MFS transporter
MCNGVERSASHALALASPVAGAVVDRWDRRRVMILSDGVQAAGTLAILSLTELGALRFWMIYGLVALSSVASAYHGPTESAPIPLIVPREHLGRASSLGGILAIDLLTFLFAVATLFGVHIPRPRRSVARSSPGAGC